MLKNSSKAISTILILVGLVVIGAIAIWSPVCSKMIELANGNMTYMKCQYTGQASILLSIVLVIAGLESLISGSRKPWTIMTIGIMLLVVTFNSKLGIGLCKKNTMACHSTAIWICGGGIVTIICGFISLINGERRV